MNKVGRMGTIEERLLRKTLKTEGCWLWVGKHKSKSSRPSLRVDGQTIPASRISFSLFKQEIPEGMEVCHTCDNGFCINPDHLFLGTHEDNMRDMAQKGRALKKLTKEQRDSISQSSLKLKELANEYGISISMVSKLKRTHNAY